MHLTFTFKQKLKTNNMKTINIKELSSKIEPMKNEQYKAYHEDRFNEILNELPHGSGLDGKMQLDLEASNNNKLVFFFDFHHMDENGYYCGWTKHNLIIKPSLQFGFDMRITSKNFNQIKEYLYDLFNEVFTYA